MRVGVKFISVFKLVKRSDEAGFCAALGDCSSVCNFRLDSSLQTQHAPVDFLNNRTDVKSQTSFLVL